MADLLQNNISKPNGNEPFALIAVFLLMTIGFSAYLWMSSATSVRSALDVPQMIAFQGKLTDQNRITVPNGSLNVKFSIYDAASGGSCLWTASGSCGTPSAISVTVTDGVFNVMLGESPQNALPDTLFNNNTLYLGISVGADAEMSPRIRIGAVGYALEAGDADLLDGFDSTQAGAVSSVLVSESDGDLALTGAVNIVNTSTDRTNTDALIDIDSESTDINDRLVEITSDVNGNETMHFVVTADGAVVSRGVEDSERYRLTDITNTDNVGLYIGDGTTGLNGTLSAQAGSVFFDEDGKLWLNTTGSTTWEQVVTTTAGITGADFLRSTASDTYEGSNDRTLTIQSDLTPFTRSTALLAITQANIGSRQQTVSLIDVDQLDVDSTGDLMDLHQAGFGDALTINVAGAGTGIDLNVTGTSGSALDIDTSDVNGSIIDAHTIATYTSSYSVGDYGLLMGRILTVNGSGQTVDVLGEEMRVFFTGTETAGDITHPAAIAYFGQLFTQATGPILELEQDGTGPVIDGIAADNGQFYRLTTTGDALGIYSGSTTPSFSAEGGSLFLKDDNAGSQTPAIYLNTSATDTGTTWTQLSTAAGSTLQAAYDSGNTIAATDARNLSLTFTDTATDPNFVVNLAGDGDFIVQDNASPFLTMRDDGTVLVTAGGSRQFSMDAAATDSTIAGVADGVFKLFVDANPAATSTNQGFYTNYESIDDANADQVFIGWALDFTNSSEDAGDTTHAVNIANVDNPSGTAVATDTLLRMNNADTTASSVTNAINILSTGVDGGITNALNVSAGNLTNAIVMGSNFAVFDGLQLAELSTGTLTIEDGSGNDIATFVDNGTVGNFTYTGRLLAPTHANNQGLRIPTNSGSPSAVTGTQEGDLVWDNTGNALYAYDGSAFINITGTGTSDTLDTVYDNDSDRTMSVDHALGINFDLTTTGDFNVLDATVPFFTLNDDRTGDFTSNVTTTNAFDIVVDSLTTGDGLAVASAAALSSTGHVFSVTSTPSSGTPTGSVVDISRTSAFGSATAVNGDLLTISNTDSTGNGNNAASLLVLTETDTTATSPDAVMKVTNAGSGVTVDLNHTGSGNAEVLMVTNAGTGSLLFADPNGNISNLNSDLNGGAVHVTNTGSTGAAFTAYSNNSAPVGPLMWLKFDHASGSSNVLDIDQDGTSSSIWIDQNGNTGTLINGVSDGGALSIVNTGNNNHGMTIYSNNTGANQASPLALLYADEATFDTSILSLRQDGTGTILELNGSNGGTGVALDVSSDSTVNNLVNLDGGLITTAAGVALSMGDLTTGVGYDATTNTNTNTTLSFDLFQGDHTATFSGVTTPTVSGNLLDLTRALTSTGASANVTISSPVATLTNTLTTVSSGVFTESALAASVLLIDQNYASSAAPVMHIDTEQTGGSAIDIDGTTLTAGRGLFIDVDGSLTDGTGSAIYIDFEAGAISDRDVFMIESDFAANDDKVFRIESDGEAFSDIGFTAGAFSTNYYDGSITSTGTMTIDSSGSVLLGTDDDLLPQLGAGDADIGASGTRWDNIFGVAGNFSGTLTANDLSCTDCLDFSELADSLTMDASTSINSTNDQLTLVSDLTAGARGTHLLLLQQANDVTNDSTGALLFLQQSDTESTGDALSIDHEGAGRGLYVQSDLNTTNADTPLVYFNQDSTSFDQPVLQIDVASNNSASRGMYVSSTSNFGTAFEIDAVAYGGDVANWAIAHTVSGGEDYSNNLFDLSRSLTIDGAGSDVTGALMTISDAAAGTSGPATHTANVLALSQTYTSAAGAVLNVTNAGNGAGVNVADADDSEFLRLSSTGDAVGFFTGSTTPSFSAEGGSLYLKDDNAGAQTPVLYLNTSATDTGTTWSPIMTGSTSTLQAAYDNGNTITATDARNVLLTLADTTTDPNFIVNLAGDGDFLVQDAGTTMFQFADNGMVGVGSTTPAHRFSVYDNGVAPLNGYVMGVHADDFQPYAAAFFNDTYSTTVPGFEMVTDLTGNFLMGNPANKNVQIYTNGFSSPRMTIDGSGNVGIGDVTPAATFVVGDTDRFQVAGATGNVTTAGDVDINGGNVNFGAATAIGDGADALTINSSGTLTIDDTNLTFTGAGILNSTGAGTDLTLNPVDDLLITPGDDTLWTLAAAGSIAIDAATTDSTVSAAANGVVLLGVDGNPTSGGTNQGLFIDYESIDDANANQVFHALAIDFLNSSEDAGDVTRALNIANLNNASGTAVATDSLIRLNNADTTAGSLTSGIIITATGGADTLTTGIDVSAGNLTNAISMGANFALFDGLRFAELATGTLTLEDTAGNDLVTFVDNGSVGTTNINGLLDVNSDTVTTSNGMHLTADGLTTGNGALFESTAAGTSTSADLLDLQNAVTQGGGSVYTRGLGGTRSITNNTASTLTVQTSGYEISQVLTANDGTASVATVNFTNAANAVFEVSASATEGTNDVVNFAGPVAYFHQDFVDATGEVLTVSQNSTAGAIAASVNQLGNGVGLSVASVSSSTQALWVWNNTQTSGTLAHFNADSIAIGSLLDIDGTGVTSGHAIDITVDESTTTGGSGLYIDYETATPASGDELLKIESDQPGNDTTIFMVEAQGAVGILTAAPLEELDIAGQIQFDLDGTTDTLVGVCKSVADAAGVETNVEFRDCSGTPGDIAEWYETDGMVSAGEIAAAAGTAFSYTTELYDPFTGFPTGTHETRDVSVLEQSSSAYQADVIGIVSTSPVQTYGEAVVEAGASYPQPVAVTGRVPLKVNAENGAIAIGDPITSSSTAGVGMRATAPGKIVGYALGAWAGPGEGTIMVWVNTTWHAGTIGTDGVMTVVSDDLAMGATGTADAGTTGYDSFGLSLRGSGWDGMAAQDVAMSINNTVTDASDYRLSIKNGSGSEVAYVTDDGAMNISGDMVIGGKLYPSDQGVAQSAFYIFFDSSLGAGMEYMRTNAAGWSTGSYDFAEMFPSSEVLEPGDVVVFDTQSEHVRRSAESYDRGVAGIVSTRPGFLAGDAKAGDYPIALAGRVPTKVSLENGTIAVGDPLTTSGRAGYAMKATKAGPIVGYALEPYDGTGDDRVIAFVNVSYWGGTVDATSTGVMTTVSGGSSSSQNLTSLNMDGDIYMHGNRIVDVGRLSGISDRWSIDESGLFTTEGAFELAIESYQGDIVKAAAVAALEHKITLSGTATLEDGAATIDFESISPMFDDITSTIAPVRVFVTLRESANGLFVVEADQNGFTVQETMGGTSNAAFDWLVEAYRKDMEPEAYLHPEDPVVEEPVTEEPVTEEPAVDPPVEEPVAPVVEEPIIEELPVEEPLVEEPAVDPPVEEPVAPVVEEPIIEELPVEEPAPVNP